MMKHHRRVGAITAVLCACVTTSVLADEPISVRGFGTLGYTQAATDDTEYLIFPSPEGADQSGTLKVDSKLGIQFDVEVNDRSSATVQLFASQDDEGNISPGLEWAYGRFQLTDSVAIRAGKLSVPVFSSSDFREVGYANTFLRPPQDVYSTAPFGTMVGVDLDASTDVGESVLEWQVGGGKLREKMSGGELTGDDFAFVNVRLNRGPATFRIGHMQFKINGGDSLPGLSMLVGGLQQASAMVPTLAQTADFVDLKDDRQTVTALGLDLDFDTYFFKAEVTRREMDSIIPDLTTWYAMAGLRVGDFTPYFYLSELKQTSATSNSDVPPVPQLAPLAEGINSLLDDVSQQSVALGVRWDFYQNVALKAQYESISQTSVGQNFSDDDPAYFGGERIGVFGLALDFVF